MKTSIAKIGNDFNKRFALYVETKETEIKSYTGLEAETSFTKEMISDLVKLHGDQNVRITNSRKAWHGGEIVDIEVISKKWDCVFENPVLSLVTAQEKMWKSRN